MILSNKRGFDLVITLIISPLFISIIFIITFFLFIFGYWPIFFVQKRIVSLGKEKKLLKFRSMNPEKVKKYLTAAKTTKEKVTGFISIDRNSGVYTKIGSFLELFKLVELPELFYVLKGDLSLVGNRPLPSNQQKILEEKYPIDGRNRILTKAGVFGVIQMAGRINFKSEQRVKLEAIYSTLQLKKYSPKRDLIILIITLLKIFKLSLVYDFESTHQILMDSSFRNLARLIAIKIKASNPTNI